LRVFTIHLISRSPQKNQIAAIHGAHRTTHRRMFVCGSPRAVATVPTLSAPSKS
jgi:hypothetical protein